MVRTELQSDRDNPELLTLLGILHDEGGHIAKADAVLRRAIKLHPGALEARHALARILSARGKYEEAIETLEEALEIGGAEARPVTLNNMGVVYERWGKEEEAREHYRRALELDGTLPVPGRFQGGGEEE